MRGDHVRKTSEMRVEMSRLELSSIILKAVCQSVAARVFSVECLVLMLSVEYVSGKLLVVAGGVRCECECEV